MHIQFYHLILVSLYELNTRQNIVIEVMATTQVEVAKLLINNLD